ncbi:MAG: TetR/AcrR family transcriptional regulator [Bacteroidales bacterium]|nr:TetR/AcrR family transcriptional regulator [Bacteroidales bacterium]
MASDFTARQTEIIHAALELIAESGIQGMTIKNLAGRIGFSESAVYRHYENKVSILLAILDYFDQNFAQLFATVRQSDKPVPEKLEALFMKLFGIFKATPSLVSVIFSEEFFRNEDILYQKVSGVMNENLRQLTNFLAQGQANGEIRQDLKAALLATIILGSVRLQVKQWQTMEYATDIVALGKELINTLKILLTTSSTEI